MEAADIETMQAEVLQASLADKTAQAAISLRELSEALAGALPQELRAVNAPLEAEEAEKRDKAQTLRASHNQLAVRVQAQQRILAREADEAFAQGQDAIAATKAEESAELQRNLTGIAAEAEACERRVAVLAEEQRLNYQRIFEARYSGIQGACVDVSVEVSKMLDSAWNAILSFESHSGATRPFVRSSHRLNLTPDEDSAYFTSLRKWYGGRGK
jgi:hypothetical protein